MAMHTQNVTALIAIDLLLAFKTMNHQILLKILDKFHGIKGKHGNGLKAIWKNTSIKVQINNSFQTIYTYLSPFHKEVVLASFHSISTYYLWKFHEYSKGNQDINWLCR